MTGLDSALYIGTVDHVRLQPFRHAFSYRIFSLLLNLDERARLGKKLRILSHNHFNLLSFHDRDHGAGDGSDPKAWVLAQLRAAGHDADTNWSIRLLCFPRILGFVFNPLAIYFCSDAHGTLQALLHQVSNTFGERHSYLLPVAAGDTVVQNCAKNFHVSPFMPVDGGYQFRIAPPAEKVSVTIHYTGPDGEDRLIARQNGLRVALTTRSLLKAVATHPLMTLKIVGGIHWEALKLWRKGATFYKKPPAPAYAVSVQPLPGSLPLPARKFVA
jgi:uncharacterized protein